MMLRPEIFLTGGTGYIGRALAARLLSVGYRVTALVRPGSDHKLPDGCQIVHGDALQARTYAAQIGVAHAFVHLVGVSHPSPRKAHEFVSVDLKSCQEAVQAASQARVGHFVYLSVARPAPLMKKYQAVRAEGERLIRESRIPATFVRPWYVLGPGHRWPMLLKPMYALASMVPSTREGAERLALVTLEQMVETLVWAVDNPTDGVRVLEPKHIRRGFGEPVIAMRQRATA